MTGFPKVPLRLMEPLAPKIDSPAGRRGPGLTGLMVSRLKGRPFYGQAMGQLRLTCTFSAECAQPEGCGIALSGDEYICRLRRSYTTLRAKRASLRKEAINCGEAATTTLAPSGASNLRTISGEAAVNHKNLFTQPFYITFLYNLWRSRAPFQIELDTPFIHTK